MTARLQITEAEFQSQVVELAQLTGWIVAHFRPARTSDGWVTPVGADGKGFPDLVLVHPSRGLLFRELKSATGKLTGQQELWLATLRSAGVDADVWRPDDIDDIEAVLTGRAS